MDADGLEELVGGISREEGHKHMLQNRFFSQFILSLCHKTIKIIMSV